MTIPVHHKVVILGDLGNHTTVDSIRSSNYFDNSIEIINILFTLPLTNDIESVATALLTPEPTAIFIGSDVPIDFAFLLAQLLLSFSAPTEIVLVNTTSTENWIQAARIGIHNIIEPNTSKKDIISAIGVALERGVQTLTNFGVSTRIEKKRGRLITVLSPKGGSGKTTVAVNVATAIAQAAPNRTLLIDFDCQFGDVATALGLSPERTLTDLGNLPNLDATSVKLFMTRDSTGSLLVLPSSGSPEEADVVDKVLAEKLLEIVLSEFDYIVVDTAAGIDERSLAAISFASDLLLIASMDVASVRNLIKEIKILDRLRKPSQTCHFVLNRFTSDSGLKIADIVEAVGFPVSSQIATSSLLLKRSNSGQVVVLTDEKSAESKCLIDLAHKFLAQKDLLIPMSPKRRRWRR
jgi:pilus assembly protein CpaE